MVIFQFAFCMFTRGYPILISFDVKPQDERPVGSVGQEGRREAVRVWECFWVNYNELTTSEPWKS